MPLSVQTQIKPSFFPSRKLSDPVVEHIVGEHEPSEQVGVVHGLQDGLVFIEGHPVLTVITDIQGLSPFDRSGNLERETGSCITSQDIDESGLAGTVATYDAHSLIPLEVVSKILDKGLTVQAQSQMLAIDDLRTEP